MTIALAVTLGLIFILFGVAKFVPVPAMRTAADHVGFTINQYRAIGALEVAGAIGIAVGLKLPAIGFAAAGGIVLLMLGAARAHITHRDNPGRILFPCLVAAVAVAYALTLI
jgi:uncharacterized membrane protein YphA (DoxX/SURF4 family)